MVQIQLDHALGRVSEGIERGPRLSTDDRGLRGFVGAAARDRLAVTQNEINPVNVKKEDLARCRNM
jgi:hypothetical protein